MQSYVKCRGSVSYVATAFDIFTYSKKPVT